ncbi:MAG: 2-oxoacid:acceptor oxidoreductase subunit alpha [Polyangiaceae bacterium]|nr:2-oxoacid:acceptor oxidoreductase subunit alpha [Polyangiaceae bacterium]
MAQQAQPATVGTAEGKVKTLRGAVVRFAGDSGDGMQVTGTQFTAATALAGNDLATFPDYPAEIRAPAGTTYGVSGFQINFSATDVFTPGDAPDVLVAMNPAALKTNIKDLKRGGLLIVNTGAFTQQNLKKAGYENNPLETDVVDGYNLLAIDITKNTLSAVKETGISTKEANRCKNFWTLGLMFWIYGRELESTIQWIESKFGKEPLVAQANVLALKGGWAYGETAEISHYRYEVPAAPVAKGTYRNIGGNQATALGIAAAAQLSGVEVVFGAYPITPASDILHDLSRFKAYGVTTVQMEDEIAAICVSIGAAYSGKLGITASSGPGIALKTEAMGLAIATELPLVIINVQRGGPSTGLPTKTEQADLLQAVYGRNGEAPLAVFAAASPGDCFYMTLEAVRLAVKYMTPVMLLTDGYLANGAEPWRVPNVADLPKIDVTFRTDPAGFHPFLRDPATLARPWAVPGTPGLLHRIGGIERDYNSGNISYDPDNHEKMSKTRAAKIAGMVRDVPDQKIEVGTDSGKLLVLGWGSTYGAIREAVQRSRDRGLDVSHAQVRYLNPFPKNLGDLLKRFERVLVPEMNLGQLVKILRSEYLVPAESFTKIKGLPFKIDEIEEKIRQVMES